MALTYIELGGSGGMGGSGFANPATENLDMAGFDIESSGGNSIWTVEPAAGGAGIQAAINAAASAGGGTVQLKAGNYVVSTQIQSDLVTRCSNVRVRGVGPATVIKRAMTGAGEVFLFGSIYSGYHTSDPAGNVAVGDTFVTLTTIGHASDYLAGDLVFITGLDGATGLYDTEVIELSGNGNPANGHLPLKTKTSKVLTSVVINASRGGANNELSDMTILYDAGFVPVPDVLAVHFSYQRNSKLRNIVCKNFQNGPSPAGAVSLISFQRTFGCLMENCIVDGSQSNGFGIGGDAFLTVKDCQAINCCIEGAANEAAFSTTFATDIKFENCLAQYSGKENFLIGTGGSFSSRRVTLENCKAWRAATNCIEMSFSGDIFIKNCDIRHAESNNGINIIGCNGVMIQGNKFEFNDQGLRTESGQSNKNIIISDNLFEKTNPNDSISFQGTDSNVLVSNNSFNAEGGRGIACYGTISDSVFEGNDFSSQAGIGIFLAAAGTTVRVSVVGNVLRSPGTNGIKFGAGATACLANGNIVSNTAVGIILVAGSADNLVSANMTNGTTISDAGTNNDLIGNKD